MIKRNGGGKRFNKGKLEFSQIPVEALIGYTKVAMYGAQKYDKFNWQKGMKWSFCFECLLRHLYLYWYLQEDIDCGDGKKDKGSGLHHLFHVLWNAVALIWYFYWYKEGDDRPKINKEERKFLKEQFMNMNFNEVQK